MDLTLSPVKHFVSATLQVIIREQSLYWIVNCAGLANSCTAIGPILVVNVVVTVLAIVAAAESYKIQKAIEI